jgi:hypothetical protein
MDPETQNAVLMGGLVVFSLYWAYACAKMAAETHPLHWGAVFGAALLLMGGAIVPYQIQSPRYQFLAAAAYLFAVVIGANRGTVALERTIRAEDEKHKRLLAYVATLGPCVMCGSGDLQRRQCDTCGVVHCAACRFKHRPYRDGHEAACPSVLASA